MNFISRGVLLASLIAVGSVAFARSVPQVNTLNPGVQYPISAQRVDANGKLVGPVFDLRNARNNQGSTESLNWDLVWDSSNANPNFVDPMNPGPETPSPLQSFYGANQPLWWFGPSYNNPFVIQDLTTIDGGWQGDTATGFTAVLSLNAAAMDPTEDITLLVETYAGSSITTAPSATGFLGGVALTYTLSNSPGAWSLTATGLSDVGLGWPIPQDGGGLGVKIGEVVAGNFVALPFASQLNWGSMLSTDEGVASVVGTNPSRSTHLQWDDDAPANFVHTANELYSYIFGTGNDPGNPIGTKIQAYSGIFADLDAAAAFGFLTFEDYVGPEPLVVPIEMVAVDAAGNPVIVAGNPLAITVNHAPGPSEQYGVINPKLSDGMVIYNRYIVSIKGSHWLRRNSPVVDLSTASVRVDLSMKNGDVSGNNEIGPEDFSALSLAFGSFIGDPNYSQAADLNGDGEVGPADFAILAGNFGEFGDEDYTP